MVCSTSILGISRMATRYFATNVVATSVSYTLILFSLYRLTRTTTRTGSLRKPYVIGSDGRARCLWDIAVKIPSGHKERPGYRSGGHGIRTPRSVVATSLLRTGFRLGYEVWRDGPPKFYPCGRKPPARI